MKQQLPITALAVFATTGLASAVSLVEGGATSVSIDTSLLASAAGLTLSSVSPDVISPGAIPGSVAFSINSTAASSLPSTFSYTSGTLAPFSGAINHSGSLLFNGDTVEVGNFSIGFDAARVAGLNSGFFVESTTGVAAILFDLANISADAVTDTSFVVSGNLAVSPEFGQFLLTNALAASDLSGANVGSAQINASAIPEPSTALSVLLASFGLIVRRRR